MAYLDNTGLAYFWGKIKAWANSAFALLGHTHPSSDVTLMTGYSKPASSSAISASDSLNQAVGKLEKGMELFDGNAVHKTGAETIAGSKIFTNNMTIAPASGPSQLALVSNANNDNIKRCVWLRNDGDYFWILYSNAGETSGWNGARTYYRFDSKYWATEDSNLVFVNNTFKASTGCPDVANGLNIRNLDATGTDTHGIIFRREPNGRTQLYLRAQEPLNSANYADLTILIDENGYKYATAPTPAANASGVEIANAAWVRTFCDTTQKYMKAVSVTGSGNAVTAASLSNGTLTLTKGSTFLTSHQSLSNYVTLDSEQTITGAKTFNSEVKVNNAVAVNNNGYYIISSTSTVRYFTCKFTNLATYNSYDTSNVSSFCIGTQVNNGNIPVNCYYEIQSDGNVRCMMRHNHWSTSENAQFVFLSYKGKGEGYVTCSIDNKYRLGIPDHRWSAVYAATAAIQTSDERLKVDAVPVPDEVLDVWEGVEWKQFKFTDSVEEKGLDGARLHAGAVAQSIGRAFAAAGLDASRYGFYCYDSWEAKDATYDDMGQILDAAQEAGDRYSLRYEEALCIEAAYMRRENARLKKRVADLEERLAALELKIA